MIYSKCKENQIECVRVERKIRITKMTIRWIVIKNIWKEIQIPENVYYERNKKKTTRHNDTKIEFVKVNNFV